MRKAPLSGSAVKIILVSLYNPRRWHRDNELTALGAIARLLHQDLIGKVPRQEEDIVGAPFQQRRGRQDGQVGAWGKATLFHSAAVDHELQYVGTDTTEVQERAAFGRCTVGGESLAG